MPFDVKNIRSIITYYQDDEPTDAQTGDVWFRPSDRRAYVRTTQGTWKRHLLKLTAGYGYVCGGYDGTNNLSTIDRFAFPFNSGTATHVGDLNAPQSGGITASCPSSIRGYVCGGWNIDGSGTHVSTINRFAFPFDSGVTETVGYLNYAVSATAGCYSSIHGYICGGYDDTGSRSMIERISYPFDGPLSSVVGSLPSVSVAHASVSSSTHGFICGGHTYSSSVRRFSFPFDSGVAVEVGAISYARDYLPGCASSTHGYACGGWDGSNNFSTVDRFAFPFDSGTATHVGDLSGTRSAPAACASSTHGYVCGGWDGSNNFSTVDRFAFPFDSGTATHVGDLSGTRNWLAACSSVDPHLRW